MKGEGKKDGESLLLPVLEVVRQLELRLGGEEAEEEVLEERL